MRLTLRTLLAYLDDILEAGKTREIGEKISESGYASALVDRIREVMRRRRLTAPDVRESETGLDPNSVAEYLDNTLAPEAVADVEKICLDSDMHLAEVASCHQILTLVLGEPVDVPAATRQRMYALGPASPTIEANGHKSAERGDKAADGLSGVGTRKKAPAEEDTAPRSRIPDYLKPPPLWRRLAPVAVGVLIGGIWLAFVYFDPSLPLGNLMSDAGSVEQPGDGSVASPEPASAADGNAGNAGPGTAAGTTAEEEVADQSGPSDESGTSTVVENGQTEPAVESQPGAATDSPPQIAELEGFDPDEEDESAATGKPDSGRRPSGAPGSNLPEAPAPDKATSGRSVAMTSPADSGTKDGSPDASSVESPAPPAPSPSEPDPAKTEPSNEPSGTGTDRKAGADTKVAAVSPSTKASPAPAPATGKGGAKSATPTETVSAPQMLYTSRDGVLTRETEEGWVVMPRRSVVRPGDRLASSNPFISLLEIDSLDLLIELHGGTRVEFVGATSENVLVLNVRSGRISMQRNATGETTEPLPIGLNLLGNNARLVLQAPSTHCGIELNPAEPTGFEEISGEDRYTGNLYVVSGRARFEDDEGEETLQAPSWMPLTPRDRKALAETKDRPPLLVVPEWLDPATPPLSPTQRRYAGRYEGEIDDEEPLRNSVPSIVKSKIPGISELAVETLAVTGQYRLLVQALAEAQFVESREAAIKGLRRWLPMSPENGRLLKEELQKYFPSSDSDDQAGILYRLLWGYDEDDARNPARSKQLVGWLEHDNPVIRQLTFQHLYRLTGQRYDYRPINPINQRKAAVERWYSHLERHGGALLE